MGKVGWKLYLKLLSGWLLVGNILVQGTLGYMFVKKKKKIIPFIIYTGLLVNFKRPKILMWKMLMIKKKMFSNIKK